MNNIWVISNFLYINKWISYINPAIVLNTIHIIKMGNPLVITSKYFLPWSEPVQKRSVYIMRKLINGPATV